MYEHVFWDMGGTIVDTYPALDATLAGVIRSHGGAVDDHDVALLTRTSTGQAIRTLSQRFGIDAAEFRSAEKALKTRWVSAPPPTMPGLAETMAAVPGLNLVVTHRDRASATSLLDALGIVVDDLICTDDGFPRKPDPAMYAELLRRHGLDAAACVAVGDRSIDAESAAGAGIPTAMLATPGIPTRVTGDHCIEHLTELIGLLVRR